MKLFFKICYYLFALAFLREEIFLPKAVFAEIRVSDSGPNRGRLAFTYTQGKSRDIYVINFENKQIRSLVQTPARDEAPAWSPDGRWLLFHSNITGDYEIYIIYGDGSRLQNLTNTPNTDEKNPAWSPDGGWIAFQSTRIKGRANIFIMRKDGSEVLPITKDSFENHTPSWSPRGRELLYVTKRFFPGEDIVLHNISSNKKELLTKSKKLFARPTWHPSSGSFAFSYGFSSESDIWFFEKGKEVPSQLTSLPGREFDPTWGARGAKLFFTAEGKEGFGKYQIYFLDMGSKKISQVTSGSGSTRHLSWTPLPAPPPLPPEPEVEKATEESIEDPTN